MGLAGRLPVAGGVGGSELDLPSGALALLAGGGDADADEEPLAWLLRAETGCDSADDAPAWAWVADSMYAGGLVV